MKMSILLLFGFLFLTSGHIFAQDYDTFLLGDGRFEISGKKPAGFNEFRYLYLEGPLLKAAKGGRLLPQPGRVTGELYGRQKFKIKTAAFEGEQLRFETVSVKGASFRFDGRVSNLYPDDRRIISPQFKGTLTKWVNGNKTASAAVTFAWLEPSD
jgi:hypothetical protein